MGATAVNPQTLWARSTLRALLNGEFDVNWAALSLLWARRCHRLQVLLGS